MSFEYIIADDVRKILWKFHILNPNIPGDIVWRSWKPQNQKSQHSEKAFCNFSNCIKNFQSYQLLRANTVITLMFCTRIVNFCWTFVTLCFLLHSSLRLPGISRAEYCVTTFFVGQYYLDFNSGYNVFYFLNKKIALFLADFLAWIKCVTFYFDFMCCPSSYLWN